MAKDDEIIVPSEESPKEEKPQPKRQEQITAEQWVERVEGRLREVLAKQKAYKEAYAGAIKAAQQIQIESLGKDEIRTLVEALDLDDVEKLLADLESIKDKAAARPDVAREVVVYEKQLEEVAAIKESRRRNVDSVARITGTGSLQQQVFENFAKYLDTDAVIHYEGNKLEVRVTADGKYIITVPEPTFDNMIALAQQLTSSPSVYGKTPQDFAQQLMDAALIMDQQAIFSSEAIEALYNTGYQLKRVFDKSLGDTAFSFEQIQGMAKTMFSALTPDQRKDLQGRINEVYLGMFLGKHDLDLRFDGDQLFVNKGKNADGTEKRGNLYDALFERWKNSSEGKEWTKNNQRDLEKWKKGMLSDKEKAEIIKKITKAYDTWLCDPKRQYDLLHRLKKFVEAKAIPGAETEQRFGVLLTQWRHMLLNSDAAKDIKGKIGESLRGKSEAEQLRIIAEFFQPKRHENGSAPALQYLPSDVLKLFGQTNPDGTYNEAACVIADAYVKHFLQENGFSVFTQLQGRHTKLIALSPRDGKAYFVDPTAPQGEVTVKEITDRALLDQLREPAKRRENGKNWEAKQQVHIRMADGTVIADGNALLTSSLMANMVGVVENLPMDVQFAAAQRAMLLFPDNPIAWLRMAQTAKDGKSEEYFHRAKELNPNIPGNLQDALRQELKIGAWTDPETGNPISHTGNNNIDAIIDQVNAWVGAEDLGSLPDARLQAVRKKIGNLIETDAVINQDANLLATAYGLLDLLTGELNNRQDRPQIFSPLTPEQINTLLRGDPERIHALIEEEVLALAKASNPGGLLPPLATERIQSHLRPMNQYLEARITSNTSHTSQIPNLIERLSKEQQYLVSITEMFEGAFNLAGLMESANAKKLEQARDYANQVDQQGGLTVWHTLSTIHDGRPVGLVSDLRREMKRVMQINFQKEVDKGRDGKYYLRQEDYLRLPEKIIPRQVDMALSGIGPYAQFRYERDNAGKIKIDPATNQPILLTPDKQKTQITEQVEMDIKFAQILFTITGEASAIYIRGRIPNDAFDPGAMAFMNAEWHNLSRYGEITPQNQAVGKRQFENASRMHLEEKYTDGHAYHLAEEVLKDKKFGYFDRYVEANALDLLSPPTQFWWENRFVRTFPMISALNDYEEQLDPAAHPTSGYESKKIRDEKDEFYDVPVGGDPEFGILLRAFFYADRGLFYDVKDTHTLLHGKATDYFPDILIEPFSYQSGVGYTEKGIPGDTRFVRLFNSPGASFLESSTFAADLQAVMNNFVKVKGITVGSSEYQQMQRYQSALLRFNQFQDHYRPTMDAIRNTRINNPNGNPVQTNFALNTADPKSAWTEVQKAFGTHANAFREFIEAMQHTLRHEGMIETMTEDPLFENQYYSPMSLIDVPMWMLDGNDLSGNISLATRHDPLRVKLGTTDRTGRFIQDALELGPKTRAAFIQLLKANPNNIEGIFKIVEQMAEGVTNTRGSGAAHELEITAVGEYMKMMLPGPFADLLGLQGVHLIKNTEYRKIMGNLVNALNREEVFSLVESHIMPTLAEKERRQLRLMLRIRSSDRLKRKTKQTFLMLLLSTIFQTAEAVFAVLNEGITKGAA